jgi:hypothetical protein
MVIPELDAVVAITSGTRNMQKIMDLVWDKLLPAMKPGRLPENPAARRQLEARLATLKIKFPSGSPSSSISSRVSGKWFEFTENDRGIKAVSFDFNSASPVLTVRTTAGETHLTVAADTWSKGRGLFTNGLEHILAVPTNPLAATSGAWTAPGTFTVKIVLYETPFYSTLNFKFDGDRLLIDAEHNVSFGPTKLPQLIGQVRASE